MHNGSKFVEVNHPDKRIVCMAATHRSRLGWHFIFATDDNKYETYAITKSRAYIATTFSFLYVYTTARNEFWIGELDHIINIGRNFKYEDLKEKIQKIKQDVNTQSTKQENKEEASLY